jgi:uncharacterized protein (DUF427 family)
MLRTDMSTNGANVKVEPSAKRVRVYLGGEVVADTTAPLLVWEIPQYPTYYLPAADVRTELLAPDGCLSHSPGLGDARRMTVKTAAKEAPGSALSYEDSPVEELRGHVRFEWNAMDAWFEEDEEVFTHPRSPYTRIDVLPSSRRVRVEVDGVTVAESASPRLLFETGLPVRYYLPKTHVRMDLLERSPTVTRCPYKGEAEYWSVRVGDRLHLDLAWSYRMPLPESERIAGLIAFAGDEAGIVVEGARD